MPKTIEEALKIIQDRVDGKKEVKETEPPKKSYVPVGDFNEKEVRGCYRFLNHLNETEIRIIDALKKLPVMSFFVHSEDEFIEVCKKYNGKFNIYAGINEREANGKDKQNVISVKTLVIDIDAIRSKGFEKEPATDEELKGAEDIADKIIESVKSSGQILPLKLCSGNGYQLWFAIPEIKIDNVNRQDIEDKVQLFQDAIIKKFDVNEAIDKIGDLPRIIKVWGTLNIKSQKGISTPERPFRVAYIVGDNYEREENKVLKKHILNLIPEKVEQYEFEQIEDVEISNLPPCVNHILKFYENTNGKFWYRIVQFLASFFMSIGLNKEKCKKIIFDWNRKQPYHEEGEEKEIDFTIERIYNKQIKVPNCDRIKNDTGGFPYFALGELKICKPDMRCKKCINPIIRYKKALEGKEEDSLVNFSNKIGMMFDKRELAERILKVQPCYYDKARNWWLWNFQECKWERVDETDILNAVEKYALINTINAKEKNEIIEALKQESRKNKPIDIKNSWIQFKDEIYDIDIGERFKAEPKWFVTNPISYKLDENNFINTPTMDKIFEEWVGKDNVQTLYEILAYCMLPDYPLHRIFCLIGGGMNGKSRYLELLRKFIGDNNVCSTELDNLIASRFEVTRLHKKLVCQMGETNFNELSNTSKLKNLSGNDWIGFEYKGKDTFDGKSYAKIIIATNNLPTTTDKTIGFYRRWLIIDFPNQFSEAKDILSEIPEEEYNALALKCCFILKDLLTNRKFTNEGSVEERIKRYEDRSNPLEKFLKEWTIEESSGYIFKWEFEQNLASWCKANRFREISNIDIGKRMKEFGIDNGFKTIGEGKKWRAWLGISWKNIKFQDSQTMLK